MTVVAAYVQIAEDLRASINSHAIKPGGQLPSELELRDRYRASRNTVLDAIKKLKDEGLVETRPGQGWFVRVRIVPFVNCLDWGDGAAIEQANASGRTPRVTPPTVSLQAAAPEMAERLRVAVGTPMIVRRQEWFLDEVPWKLQDVWVPRARFDEGAHRLLMAEDIPQGLGAYLHETLGLRPASATFLFLPRKPSDEEGKFFGFPAEGEIPYIIELIRTASMSADNSGPRPLYAVVGVYAGDRNRFASSRLELPAAESLVPARGDAHQCPGGLGARARGVPPERSALLVLPPDGEREFEECACARTRDDRDDANYRKTGHHGLQTFLRGRPRIQCLTGQTDRNAWIV